jgi:hypothetical protein
VRRSRWGCPVRAVRCCGCSAAARWHRWGRHSRAGPAGSKDAPPAADIHQIRWPMGRCGGRPRSDGRQTADHGRRGERHPDDGDDQPTDHGQQDGPWPIAQLLAGPRSDESGEIATAAPRRPRSPDRPAFRAPAHHAQDSRTCDRRTAHHPRGDPATAPTGIGPHRRIRCDPAALDAPARLHADHDRAWSPEVHRHVRGYTEFCWIHRGRCHASERRRSRGRPGVRGLEAWRPCQLRRANPPHGCGPP